MTNIIIYVYWGAVLLTDSTVDYKCNFSSIWYTISNAAGQLTLLSYSKNGAFYIWCIIMILQSFLYNIFCHHYLVFVWLGGLISFHDLSAINPRMLKTVLFLFSVHLHAWMSTWYLSLMISCCQIVYVIYDSTDFLILGTTLWASKMGSRRPKSNHGTFGPIPVSELYYNERRYTAKGDRNTLKINDTSYRGVSLDHFVPHEPHVLGHGGNSSVQCYRHIKSGTGVVFNTHHHFWCVMWLVLM